MERGCAVKTYFASILQANKLIQGKQQLITKELPRGRAKVMSITWPVPPKKSVERVEIEKANSVDSYVLITILAMQQHYCIKTPQIKDIDER